MYVESRSLRVSSITPTVSLKPMAPSGQPTLAVMKISDRGTPLFWTAAPTCGKERELASCSDGLARGERRGRHLVKGHVDLGGVKTPPSGGEELRRGLLRNTLAGPAFRMAPSGVRRDDISSCEAWRRWDDMSSCEAWDGRLWG